MGYLFVAVTLSANTRLASSPRSFCPKGGLIIQAEANICSKRAWFLPVYKL